jgi:hypothetical protein
MDRTEPSERFFLEFVSEAAGRRRSADQHLRRTVVAARAVGLQLPLIAEAAGLSVSRVHAIADEEEAKMARSAGRAQATVADARDVLVVAAGRAAAREYLDYGAYVCQPNRSFRDVERLGFYRRRQIEPYFPEVRHRVLDAVFSREHAQRLRATGSPIDRELADLIDAMLTDERRHENTHHQVFLLTAPDDPRTLVLDEPIHHAALGRGSAWTQGTRYTSEARLRQRPRTTAELDHPTAGAR